jgi:hypothetical protein
MLLFLKSFAVFSLLPLQTATDAQFLHYPVNKTKKPADVTVLDWKCFSCSTNLI